MQYANIIVSIAMAILGYGAFVFITEKMKPHTISVKGSSKEDKSRRHYILGLLAGCLVALSSLAAWLLNSGSIIEGLKASFIVAAISLLILLAVDWIRRLFIKRKTNSLAHLDADTDTSTDISTGKSIDTSTNEYTDISTGISAGTSIDTSKNENTDTSTDISSGKSINTSTNEYTDTSTDISTGTNIDTSTDTSTNANTKSGKNWLHNLFKRHKPKGKKASINSNEEIHVGEHTDEHNTVVKIDNFRNEPSQDNTSLRKNNLEQLDLQDNQSQEDLTLVETTEPSLEHVDLAPDYKNELESVNYYDPIELQKKHVDEMESNLREHTKIVQEKTDTINALENTITELRNETDALRNETAALTEKANRLDNSEANLLTVQHELSALKTRDQESISLSEKAIEKLRAENRNLQQEADQAQSLKHEIENNQVELQRLQSDNEHLVQMSGVLEKKEDELNALRQELELKDKIHNELVKDLTEEKSHIRSNVPDLEKLKLALASNEKSSNEIQIRLHKAALKEREGRLKMEASAKRAVTIARQAINKLHEHENKLNK